MEYAVLFATVVLVLVAFSWQVTAKTRVWVIRIRSGLPALVKGKIPQTVVAELAEVLRRHNVRRGAVFGIKRRGTVTLGFSRSIPLESRQALRNVWSMHAH